jgi:class 3 adenylate cyclase
LIRYIPPFILEHYGNGEKSGTFTAFVLNLDLTDYTAICNDLMTKERHGAEEIKLLLEIALTYPLEQVHNNGGIVIRYTGDAFFALFPERDPNSMLSAAMAIRDHFREHNVYSTSQGDYQIKVSQIVAYGPILWQVFENDYQNEYAFSTAAGAEYAAIASLHPELGFSPQAAERIGFGNFRQEGVAYVPSCKRVMVKPYILEFKYDPAIRNKFIHSEMNTSDPASDIRFAVCCIISFADMDRNSQKDVIARLEQLAVTYGGFVNKILSLDQIRQAMILFGMPRNKGNMLYRACRFALETVRAIPEAAIGLRVGPVFAGQFNVGDLSEYTALGSTVNLASRFAGLASPGQIVVGDAIRREFESTFTFKPMGTQRVRGIKESFVCYSLDGYLPGGFSAFRGKFVGRSKEKKILKEWISEALSSPSCLEFRITGEAGIGKTRLLSEVLQSLPDRQVAVITVNAKSSGSKPLDPSRNLFLQLLGLDALTRSDLSKAKVRKIWSAWAGNDEVLLRLEPLVMYMMGFPVSKKAQSFEQVAPRTRGALLAWHAFLDRITGNRKLIFCVDDAQLIDINTESRLREVVKSFGKTRALIFVHRSANDKNPSGAYMKDAPDREIVLEPLDLRGSFALYKSLLGVVRLPELTRKLIRDNTLGNPQIISNFIFYMLDNNWVGLTGELYLDGNSAQHYGISDIISQRIDDLTDKGRACASCASVLGIKFEVPVLAVMLGWDPQAELAEGSKQNLWHTEDNVSFEFSQIVIIEYLYRSMLKSKQRELHLLAAKAIEKVYNDNLEIYFAKLAWHYQNAGEQEKADKYSSLVNDLPL